jgi:hypothetical protein
MELACDVIKRKGILSNSRFSEDINNMQKQLRKIDICSLFKKMSHGRVERYVNMVIDPYFENSPSITKSIIFSYYISMNNNEDIEKIYGTLIEDKLLFSSKSLVAFIEYGDNNVRELLNKIDYHYSVYSAWKKKDKFVNIDNYFCQLEEKIKIHRIINSRNMRPVMDIDESSVTIIRNMMVCEPKIAIKKLLSEYNAISSTPELSNYFWNQIKRTVHEDNEKIEHIFLIMVAELRIMLIRKLKNSKDRKNIYYNVDIENIVDMMRDKQLTITEMKRIVMELSSNCNKLDGEIKCDISSVLDNFDVLNQNFVNLLINSFHMMFDFAKKS